MDARPPVSPSPLIFDAGAAWRAAQLDETLAYRAWCDAAPHERRAAYAVFLAAADRSAAAADMLWRRSAA